MTTENVFVIEINLDKLLAINTGKPKYKEISKLPSIKKDIALVLDKSIQSEEVAKTIKKACGNNLSKVEVFDVYEGKGIDENKKSIAYSLTFSSQDRTLTDDEINPLLEKIVEMTEKEFNAELRG